MHALTLLCLLLYTHFDAQWETTNATINFQDVVAYSVTKYCALLPEACSLITGCSQFYGYVKTSRVHAIKKRIHFAYCLTWMCTENCMLGMLIISIYLLGVIFIDHNVYTWNGIPNMWLYAHIQHKLNAVFLFCYILSISQMLFSQRESMTVTFCSKLLWTWYIVGSKSTMH